MKRTWMTALVTVAAMLCVCAVLFGITGIPSLTIPGSETSAAPADTVHAAEDSINTVSPAPNASTNLASAERETLNSVEGDTAAYEEGAVLATLADGVTPDEAIADLNTIAQLEGVSLENSVTDTVVKLSLPPNVSVEEATALAQTSNTIKTAGPNHYLYTQEMPSASDTATSTLVQENVNQNNQLIAGTALGDALSVQDVNVNVTTNDPKYIDGTQWSLKNANVTDTWKTVLSASLLNQPTTVAVVDAGFDVNHNDLKANVAAQYDATTKTSSINPDNPDSGQCDHGTHASGIISANTNNALGVAGVAYNTCKVLPIRVQDANGSIKTQYLLEAFDYICENVNEYNIRVINMSLGAATYETVTRDTFPQLYDAIDEAREHGIVTVVAACNSGTKGTDEEGNTKKYYPPFHAFPSDFDNVVSVMNLQESTSHATDNNVTRASTSNYNVEGQHAKNISAPGNSIYGLISSQQYGYKNGTSMASPLVAGVLGLMFQVNPELTQDEATEILYSTARDLTTGDHMGEGWDEGSGYGEVDAAEAVTAAMGTTHRIDISKLPITIPNERYTGENINPTVLISEIGVTLDEGVDYKVTAGSDYIDAGTYSLTLTGMGAYMGTAHVTFTIEKVPLTYANLALGTTELNYNGSVQYAKDSLAAFDIGKNGSTKLVEGASGDIIVTDPGVILGPGTVTITATSACKNFTGTATLDYIVGTQNIAELDITVSKACYSGKAIEPTVKITGTGTTLVEGIDFEVEAEGDCVNAGDYPLTIVGKGAYTGSASATFTIEKAPLSQANLELETTNLTYNGSIQYAEGSLSAFDIGLNADTPLTHGTDGDFTAEDSGVKLGTGTVTLTATSTCKNFTGAASLSYTVKMKKAQVYALYNKKTKQWFYTASSSERTTKLKAGWANKGKAWKTPSKSTKPVWRLYNKKTGAYRYTTSKSTRSKLVKDGWKYQKIAWYADDYYETNSVYAQYKKSTGTWRYTKQKTLSGFVNKGAAFYCL